MRYWWVNQGGSYKIEHPNSFMWSPKRESDNVRSQAYENMRLVAPGDLIISHYDKHIRAIGTAQSYSFSCQRPKDFPLDQNHGNNDGWKIKVHYRHDITPLSPKEHFDVLQPLLPEKYGPLDKNGVAVMKLYLSELDSDLAEKILEIMKISESDFPPLSLGDVCHVELNRIQEEEELKKIEGDLTIPETVRLTLGSSRVGQGVFKDRVCRIEKECRVTKVVNPHFLIASHIKPWRDSNNQERLDGENGLLLSPSIDWLFDKYFISFTDEGRLLISPLVDLLTVEKFGLVENMHVGPFTSGQKKYLAHHRARLKGSDEFSSDLETQKLTND